LKIFRNDNVITHIEAGSIADKMGIIEGDILVAINGQAVEDVIDYRFLTADEHLEVTLTKTDGSEWILEIEKEYDEALGIEFDNPVMAETRQCHNKCIFCFIDQMPPGMREGLYIKDDDSRLSFLQGNYITLTNLKKNDIEKLIKYHISPLNISVHTTNPDLRISMLHNQFAGNIMESLTEFHSNKIQMNIQIVLCPGFNDQLELDRTLGDLEHIADSLISVAIVPVGLTKYQKNQALVPVTAEKAAEVVRQVEEWQSRWISRMGRKLAYPSDEFYLKAKLPWPNAESYEAFYQLENGVGMMASFEKDFLDYQTKMPLIKKHKPFNLTIATGVAAENYMRGIADQLITKVAGLSIRVIPIQNRFFGESIDVSGLVTGQDLVHQLINKDLGNLLMIPANMLKSDEPVFLDDLTLEEASEKLKIKIIPCQVDGKGWIKEVLHQSAEKPKSRSGCQNVKTNCCRRRQA
jgi:putative radical SAM enzyme (TIGR03279 family)